MKMLLFGSLSVCSFFWGWSFFGAGSGVVHGDSTEQIRPVSTTLTVPVTQAATTTTENNHQDTVSTSLKVAQPEGKSVSNTTSPNTTLPNSVSTTNQTVQVQVTNSTAQKVEMVATPSGSTQEIYLGSGQKTNGGMWTLGVNAGDRLPNGTYEVKTKQYLNDGKVQESNVSPLLVNVPGSGSQTLSPEEQRKEVGQLLSQEHTVTTLLPKGSEDPVIVSETPRDNAQRITEAAKNASDPAAILSTLSDTRLSVQSVALTDVVTTSTSDHPQTAGKKALHLEGKGVPGAFVTLFIYSDTPIVVTVKADAQGNWTYDLDKELENGNHQVYVAVTDSVGKITAQSSPFSFVKTATAATAIAETVPAATVVTENQSPLDQSRSGLILGFVTLAVAFIGLAFVIISLLTRRRSTPQS